MVAGHAEVPEESISAADVAEHVAGMTCELAVIARNVGLEPIADALERAHELAEGALRELHAEVGNAAPEDAA